MSHTRAYRLGARHARERRAARAKPAVWSDAQQAEYEAGYASVRRLDFKPRKLTATEAARVRLRFYNHRVGLGAGGRDR